MATHRCCWYDARAAHLRNAVCGLQARGVFVSGPSGDEKTGNFVYGAFTPLLAKHSKSFSLIDCMSVGVDRMQRNFEPIRRQVEAWQRSELTDVTAKVVIYGAFVEGKLEAPKHLSAPSMTFTSSRSTKSSVPARSGVFQTPSLRF